MRTYEKTHPWISFVLDPRRLPAMTWIALGEALSKCEHISNAPLRPKTAEELHKLYFAKGARGTTAIEGNTLTEEQVLLHLEGKLHLPPSKAYLQREIDNIVDACNGIEDAVLGTGAAQITFRDIVRYNQQVLRDLDVEDGVIPGTIRAHEVGVAGTRYKGPPADECEYLLKRLCQWLNTDFVAHEESHSIVYAILKAVLAHLYLAWIHPFGDGNGRTARLAEFHILLASGVPTPAAHLLSNYYNETRPIYYRQLDQASKSGGDVLSFLDYAITGFVEGLRSQLTLIWEQHWDVTWRNYVHELFGSRTGKANRRRRDLALDLSRAAAPVPTSELRELTPRLATQYAGKSSKTVSRDVNILQEMSLVAHAEKGLIANRWLIQQFLPTRAKPSSADDM